MFTGTTGKSEIEFSLPDYLKNEKRYIFAIVEIGNTSNDFRGQKFKNVDEAFEKGEILFGETSKLVSLNSGRRISDIKFKGNIEGVEAKNIYFTMPDTYLSGDSPVLIPDDKEVTFYCVDEQIGNTFSTNAYMFHGTTGSTKITKAMLPEALVGQSCYFYAVVNLDGFYDLRGKTIDDVIEAIYNGKVLFGKSMDPIDPDEMKMYSLRDGINIDNFVFHGPIPDGVINFVMPEKCVSGTPIPPGKAVKFYALKSTEEEPLKADRVFTGTTGSGNIQCTLPGRLIDKDYYFFAVVNIRGSFDLHGKTKQDLKGALSRGEVFFGQSKEPLGQNNKLYTLTDGITIDNFEFIDRVDQGSSKIKFTIPAKYKGPSSEQGADDGQEFDIPGGKRIKFYAITYEDYNKAQGGTTTINCELIHEGTTGGSNTYTADLPDHLLNQERYFLALIVLSEDYDLSRMKIGDLMSAMLAGKVLYGRHLISGPGDSDVELVKIVSGINEIDNFEFQGQEP